MQGYLKEVNVKFDMPPADEAIKRVEAALNSGKKLGAAVVKIVHGYGSTGNGGKIRTRTRKYLAGLKEQGAIRDYIPGEDFSIFNSATRAAFSLCADLRGDEDLDRYNSGVTFIIL